MKIYRRNGRDEKARLYRAFRSSYYHVSFYITCCVVIRNPVLYPPELRGRMGRTYCMVGTCADSEGWDSSANEAVVIVFVIICERNAVSRPFVASCKSSSEAMC